MANNGFEITHVYGLTETYGPATFCDWDTNWNTLPNAEQAEIKAAQGVTYHVSEDLMVAHPETLEQVPFDGKNDGRSVFQRK